MQSESSGGSAGSSAASGGSAVEGGAAGAPEDEGIALDRAAGGARRRALHQGALCVKDAAMVLLFNEEDCTELVTGVLENSTVANIAASDADGTLSYDGTKLPACLDAYQALACGDVIVDFPETCKIGARQYARRGRRLPALCRVPRGPLLRRRRLPAVTCSAFLAEGAACSEAMFARRGSRASKRAVSRSVARTTRVAAASSPIA